MMFYVASLLCGTIFGLGLAVSGMVNPAKVLNFLDVSGTWDPTLALVFVGALVVATPAYQWILRTRASPVAAQSFDVPRTRAITPSLLAGSVLFGVGWGLAGFCPGPSLTATASLLPSVLAFVAAMFAGAGCYRFLFGRGSGDG